MVIFNCAHPVLIENELINCTNVFCISAQSVFMIFRWEYRKMFQKFWFSVRTACFVKFHQLLNIEAQPIHPDFIDMNNSLSIQHKLNTHIWSNSVIGKTRSNRLTISIYIKIVRVLKWYGREWELINNLKGNSMGHFVFNSNHTLQPNPHHLDFESSSFALNRYIHQLLSTSLKRKTTIRIMWKNRKQQRKQKWKFSFVEYNATIIEFFQKKWD